jgi:hypothetical protein
MLTNVSVMRAITIVTLNFMMVGKLNLYQVNLRSFYFRRPEPIFFLRHAHGTIVEISFSALENGWGDLVLEVLQIHIFERLVTGPKFKHCSVSLQNLLNWIGGSDGARIGGHHAMAINRMFLTEQV